MSFREEEIDRRILPLVKILNQKGYRTISSCEGHLDAESGLWSKANVVFYADKKRAARLKDILYDLVASGQINEMKESDAVKNLYAIIIQTDYRERTDSVIDEIVRRLSAEESVDYQEKWERKWKET